MHRKRMILLVTALALAVSTCGLALISGWNQARHTQAAPSAPNDVVVSIGDFYFDPPALTVSLGTTVIWQNQGDVTHTVSITNVVSSGDIGPGEIFTHTFYARGIFAYQCAYYSDMQASVTVVDAREVPVDVWVSAWHDQVVGAGAAMDYHVEYANSTSFDAQTVALTVTLPAASTLVTSTRSGDYYPPSSRSGRVLVYNIGALAAYDSGVIDLIVALTDTLKVNDLVVLAARLAAVNPDPYPDNNYAEDSQAIPGANMTISTRPAYDSGPFVPGGVVTYTVEYYNQASYMDAAGVVVTDRLPSGVTFLGAFNDDWSTVAPIAPITVGNELRFNLGTLPPGAGGQLSIQARLSPALNAKTVLRNMSGVATTVAETTYEDNWAFDEQSVMPVLPDLWVELRSSTDGQIDGYHSYWLSLGNAGPQDASHVTVTLSIPIGLAELDFSAWPDRLVTRTNDYLATWFVGPLAADSWGNGLSVNGRIDAAGEITATATITSSSREADPTDNLAQASDFNAEIQMPIIDVPSTAIVGPQPVFYGLGQPGATVSLFLSGTLTVRGQRLGQASVDEWSRWVLTPASPLTQTGWYWFTATQQLNGRVSPATGVGNFVTDTASLIVDTNSMVRYVGTRPFDSEGEPVGGINQPLGWRRGVIYTLGARLTRCEPYDPISPTLQVLLYNDDGLMVGHQDLAATYTETLNGYVEFEFGTPENNSPFELFLKYYCPVPATLARGAAKSPLQPSGWWQDLKDWFGCWESLGCDKPDPPPPPKPGCPGCTPLPRPRPRPQPTDPDGFVYDCSMVRAGATITQSIITQAWVTATQRIATGDYAPWNALDFDQVNPQYTGPLSVWPDKVARLGYFSFLVPAGSYRLLAAAPGYVPFQSQVLYVTNSPVTLNIPMKRPGDVADCAPSMHSVYLPIVIR